MSVQQLEALIEYLEGQPELALGRCSRSKEGRSLAKRLWQQCAEVLNSISSDCVQKTAEQWRMFYNEYKHRLLKKIKKEKSEKTATGGGPPIEVNLTPIQERLYIILGRDVGEPIPGVRHNPLTPIENDGGNGTSDHDGVNVVVDEMPQDAPGSFQMELVGFDPPGPSGSQLCELLAQTEQVQQSGHTASQASMESVETRLQGLQSEPAGSQDGRVPQRVPHSQQSVPRRRRRRRREITEPEDPSMRRATERLEAIEELSAQATREHAQATREHAQATNRLAAALEALGETLKIIVEDPPQMVHRVRKRRIIIHDDSD